MRVGFARPDVSTLVFRLFGRSVHPELFTTFAVADYRHEAYRAQIRVCDAGHVLSFAHAAGVLTEVATSAAHPLPSRLQVIARRLRGYRNESVEHDAGILYHMSFQVEHLEPEVFQHFHEELLVDSQRCRVSHRFHSASRLGPAPLSLLQVEETAHSLLVHAFHTFPDNLAVVKTQSLFEVPRTDGRTEAS